jgi:uncharacterized membrane protein required for colicin V production
MGLNIFEYLFCIFFRFYSGELILRVFVLLLGSFIKPFDSFFVKNSGLRSLNLVSLTKIRTFNEDNQSTIEEIRKATHTIDFTTGEPTKHLYTRAKMIDMIFFVSS